MNFNNQDRECHPERSEGSDVLATEILRCAQDDMAYEMSGFTETVKPDIS